MPGKDEKLEAVLEVELNDLFFDLSKSLLCHKHRREQDNRENEDRGILSH
jgi:hypothetical protein